jgi:hypothetical protein
MSPGRGKIRFARAGFELILPIKSIGELKPVHKNYQWIVHKEIRRQVPAAMSIVMLNTTGIGLPRI